MQCVKITGGGKTFFFLADLVPTAAHLPYPWMMGYDLYPLTTLETKKKWLPRVAQENWTVVFGHDPHTPAGSCANVKAIRRGTSSESIAIRVIARKSRGDSNGEESKAAKQRRKEHR